MTALLRLMALGCVLLLLAPLSAGEKTAKIDIRGTIKKLTPTPRAPGRNTVLGSVYIEAPREKKFSYDKAVIRVTTATKLFKQVGEQRKPATFADLKEGQTVAVRFVGPVAESYPVQASAGTVVILAERAKK